MSKIQCLKCDNAAVKGCQHLCQFCYNEFLDTVDEFYRVGILKTNKALSVCLNCCRARRDTGCLCAFCWCDKDIRAFYEPLLDRECFSIDSRRGLAPETTKAIPGTKQKKRIMEVRVQQGYEPTHPDDLNSEDIRRGLERLAERIARRIAS